MSKSNLKTGNRSLFALSLVAFFAVGAVFAANYLSGNRVLVNSGAATGPIYVSPCDGVDWNNTGCFNLTNTSKTAVNLKYFLDCWDETKCKDEMDTVLIEPGETISLGLGTPCSKWQLDINWSGNEGWDWGGVIEISPNCGTPTPTPTPVVVPTPTVCTNYIELQVQ